MVRWSVLAAGAAVVVGAAFVTGASLPTRTSEQQPKQNVLKHVSMTSQKIGFINMRKLMGEYKRAVTATQHVVERRDRLAHNLAGLREMYHILQSTPRENNPREQEQAAHDMVLLGRQIEDLNREYERSLKNQSAQLIVDLHDELQAVTAEVAHVRGLSAVLAYPDASVPEELDSPQLKEMRLKPPALMPFYLDPALDFTDEVIELLNARFPTED